MMSSNERVDKAQDIVLERLDYVMSYYAAPDFVEVTGSIGGDVVTYRVYDNGTVTER